MPGGSLFKKAAKALAGGAKRAGAVGLDAATTHADLGSLKKAFLQRPLGTAVLGGLGVAGAAPLVGDLGGGLTDAGRLLGGRPTRLAQEALRQEATISRMDAFDRARRERMAIREEAIRRNAAALQALAPDLHAQVMAGIPLPEGAIAIGGAGPREDLVRELAGAMADEEFMDPDAQNPLQQLVS